MTIKSKLKILIAILFIFIIVLAALLIYAKTIYNKDGDQANTTISTITEVSQQSPSGLSEVQETIDLKLYYFDADSYDNAKEIRTVTVDKKLYQDDITAAINKVLSSANISIKKATINGSSITVDLSKEVALKFNGGSAAGIMYTNTLAMTILNLPDIEKLEVTVDGVANVVADHFYFNGTYSKVEDGKKYNFTNSDEESKLF
ncbi:MAG: GerMN domain-containing protein [Ruminiclostridium sp.]